MIVRCEWHQVDEDDEGAFWTCGECMHVWPTQQAYDADVAELDRVLEVFTRMPVTTNPRALLYCPLCAHNW